MDYDLFDYVHGDPDGESLYGEEEDRSSTSSKIDPDLEIALYSQIHFDQNPDALPTEEHFSETQIVVEEEVLEPQDSKELQWRERLLGLGSALTKKPCVSERDDGANLKENTSETLTQNITKEANISSSSVSKSPVKKSQIKGKSTKKTPGRPQPDISAFLVRENEPENKLDSIRNKYNKNKTSTPKQRATIVISEDSSDSSDFDVKDMSISQMIVIDSISDDSDSGNAGSRAGTIVLSTSEDEGEFTKTVYSSSETSEESSIFEIDETTDIRMNMKGISNDFSTAAYLKKVPLDNAELEDYMELTVDDIQHSLAECDWSLCTADRYNANDSSMSSRYFNPEKLSVKCHNCNERGHMSRECPQPKKRPTCIMCGLEGHFTRACPLKCCYNCLKIGHSRESCTERRRYQPYCSRCKMEGHITQECTDLWRQYHSTTSEDDFIRRKSAVNKRKFCYNCARPGHFGYDCRVETMEYYQLPHYTQIAKYCPVPPHLKPAPKCLDNVAGLERPHESKKELNRRVRRNAQTQAAQKVTNKGIKNSVKNSAFVKSSVGTSPGKKKNHKKKPKGKPHGESVSVNERETVDKFFSVHQVSGKVKKRKPKQKKKKSAYEGDFVRSVPHQTERLPRKKRNAYEGVRSVPPQTEWVPSNKKGKRQKRKSDQDLQTGFQRSAKRTRFGSHSSNGNQSNRRNVNVSNRGFTF